MNDLSHDELVSLSPVVLAEMLDRGLVDRDVTGHLFVTLKGMALRARSARDVMLMRLSIPPCPEGAEDLYPVRIRTGPEAHFTIRTDDTTDPDARERAINEEARQLAEARYAAQLTGEIEIQPPRHLRAV